MTNTALPALLICVASLLACGDEGLVHAAPEIELAHDGLEFDGVELSTSLAGTGLPVGNKFNTLGSWFYALRWLDQAQGMSPGWLKANYPNLEWIRLVSATGGTISSADGGDGSYDNADFPTDYSRDLYVDVWDRNSGVDASALVRACRNMLAQGVKPWIYTGHVPLANCQCPEVGVFGRNIRPAQDVDAYEDYIRAIAQQLVGEFGIDEVQKWRWGFWSEMNQRWHFRACDNTLASSEIEIFKLYDHTVAALESVVGAEHLYVGAHAVSVLDPETHWSPKDFLNHCRNGINDATGSIGTQLDYLSTSYYNGIGGVERHQELGVVVNRWRRFAREVGYTDELIVGIDELGALDGTDGERAKYTFNGKTYMAAWTAMLFQRMLDEDVDHAVTWHLATDGMFRGAKLNIGHVNHLAYTMAGSERRPVTRGGASSASGDTIDGVAAYDPVANKVRVLAYNFNESAFAAANESVRLNIRNVAPLADGDVTVKTWRVDDDHGCFFDEWEADRVRQGITAADYKTGYSIDSFYVTKSLRYPDDIEYWYSRLPTYSHLSELPSPTTAQRSIDSGILTIDTEIPHHGVILVEVLGAKKEEVTLLSRWSFDDDAQDVAGSYHGALHGNTSFSTDRKEGTHSLFLAGATGYVDMDDVLDFEKDDAFSIAFWIKPHDVSSWGSIVSKQGDDSTNGWAVLNAGSGYDDIYFTLRSTKGDPGNQIVATSNEDQIPVGKWAHVALTYDGSARAAGVKLYVDGALLAGGQITFPRDSLTGSTQNTVSMNVGARDDGDHPFDGWIDDLRVYGGVLNADQVRALLVPDCADADGDGYGNPASSSCAYALRDCDDAEPAVHPGAAEVCNERDDDCDNLADEDFDLRSDPGNCGSCAHACGTGDLCVAGICDGACNPNCDGRDCGDDGCGGICGHCDVPTICSEAGVCSCPSGLEKCGTECVAVDTDPYNCGVCANRCPSGLRCDAGTCSSDICTDSDGDGHSESNCGGDDCDDANAAIHPDAAEVCDDGTDNDCDGQRDREDSDCSGTPPSATLLGGCSATARVNWWMVLLGLGAVMASRTRLRRAS